MHQRTGAARFGLAGWVLVAAAAVAGLLLCAPQPGALLASLGTLGDRARGAPADVVVDAAAALAWLCLGWLCLGAVLTAAGRLPGAAGRVFATIARRITPRVIRSAVQLACGATVVAGPLLGAAPGYAAPVGGTAASTAGPALDWPPAANDPQLGPIPATSGPRASAHPGPDPSPSLDWPSTATPSKAARPAHGHRAAPAASPKTGASGVPAHPSAPAPDRHVVVVRRGDTLWAIAAAHLPGDVDDAAIAAAWPRWYAANRAVVGPDPDLLLPGQRLHAPDPLSPPSAEDHAHGSTP